MPNKIFYLLNEKRKIEDKLKKINDESYRQITDNLSIGFSYEKNLPFIQIHGNASKRGFKNYFPAERIHIFIDELKRLKESIDNL